MPTKLILPVWALAASCALAMASAQADPIAMTLNGPYDKDDGAAQQVQDDPCIYGGSDCKGAPGWPGIKAMPTGSSGDPGDSVGVSPDPLYESYKFTVGYITDLFDSTEFDIGIDTNSTANSLETLLLFQVIIGGEVKYQYTGPANLVPSNNGTGWTDYILSSFSLAGYSPETEFWFRLSMTRLGDGADSFYFLAREAPEVPEPATLGLLGLGLFGLGFAKRKKA